MASQLLLLLLLTAAAATAGFQGSLRSPGEARGLSFHQLDELFKHGAVEGGIPEGFAYGFAMVSPSYPGWQVMADAYWHGKHFEVLFPADPAEDCAAGHGVIKGCGGPRGIVTNYLSLLPNDKHNYYQEMPGLVYIGHLRDIHSPLKALELDDKLSIIVDYRNKGGDEIRLVSSPEEGIYLGRGTAWSSQDPHIFAYFVLQFSPVPLANEINWPGPAHTRLRDETFEAAGVPGGDPNPTFIQERRVRRRPGGRQQPRHRPSAERDEGILPVAAAAAEEEEGKGGWAGAGAAP